MYRSRVYRSRVWGGVGECQGKQTTQRPSPSDVVYENDACQHVARARSSSAVHSRPPSCSDHPSPPHILVFPISPLPLLQSCEQILARTVGLRTASLRAFEISSGTPTSAVTTTTGGDTRTGDRIPLTSEHREPGAMVQCVMQAGLVRTLMAFVMTVGTMKIDTCSTFYPRDYKVL